MTAQLSSRVAAAMSDSREFIATQAAVLRLLARVPNPAVVRWGHAVLAQRRTGYPLLLRIGGER